MGKKKNKSRNFGHYAGVKTVKKIVESSIKFKIPIVTFYVFSTENWKRPKTEINFLFNLVNSYFKSELQNDVKAQEKIMISSFDDLLIHCSNYKEMKLKYELEKNVNLVSFDNNRIEISFNDNLDKNFVKDLSLKLFEWTGQRWIISFSKTKGEISIKEKEKNKKTELIEKAKNTNLFKNVLEKFPDANLIDVVSKKNKGPNDWF